MNENTFYHEIFIFFIVVLSGLAIGQVHGRIHKIVEMGAPRCTIQHITKQFSLVWSLPCRAIIAFFASCLAAFKCLLRAQSLVHIIHRVEAVLE